MVGIDFGAKKAGTTAMAYFDEGAISVNQIEKGHDADAFLVDFLQTRQPDQTCIDAPLSLPGVYTQIEGAENYFYRTADAELQAMSPMFLGGLTARAMKLKNSFPKIAFYETYPGAFMKYRFPELRTYKKKEADPMSILPEILHKEQLDSSPKVSTWHEFDAIICLLIGLRLQGNNSEIAGLPDEGLIYY